MQVPRQAEKGLTAEISNLTPRKQFIVMSLTDWFNVLVPQGCVWWSQPL